MNSHSFTFEQYCSIVGKNIILEETAYHNGKKSLKCLYCHKCSENGGCRNRFVKQRIENVEKSGK